MQSLMQEGISNIKKIENITFLRGRIDTKRTPVSDIWLMQMWYKFQPAGLPNFLEISKSLEQTV